MRRPHLGDDLQKLNRLLPVLGELLRHQRGELVENRLAGTLRFHHVHEARQLGGQMGGLGRRVGTRRRGVIAEEVGRIVAAAYDLRPLEHELGERKPPRDFADGGGKVEGIGTEGCVGGKARQQREIVLALGDRPDARQHHGGPAAG